MIKKSLTVLVLAAVIAGGVILWHQYRNYRVRQQDRIQRLQAQAEELQATTIEGWTAADIAKALEEKKLFAAKEFLAAENSFDVSAYPLIKASKPKKASLEGFLFPDTYRFNKTSTPQIVLDKMLANFTLRLDKIGVSADKEKYPIPGYEQYPLTFYQVLTMASLIEKESGGKGPMSLSDERAMIAGVFYNRLAKGQALESDAAVNYATGKSNVSTTESDRSINSPYNTYKYPGLPPGPICNPSLASIAAALHPQKTDYQYFFHKQPSGEAVFSKTFAEHKKQLQEK
jgi:UPF0755 protein